MQDVATSEGREIKRPDICISINSEHLDPLAQEFLKSLKPDGFVTARTTHGNLFAGVEWLMPTAVVLYLMHTFFGAMISEAGKDTYKRLKSSAVTLYGRTSPLKISLIATAGKVEEVPRYSLGYSIVVPTSQELIFKFLIQPGLSQDQASEAIWAFFDLMLAFADGTITPDVLHRLEQGRAVSRTLLLAYDFELRSIVTVDPLPNAPNVK